MRRILPFLIVLMVASCRARREREWPVVPTVPPAPPEQVLRHNPDYEFRDEAGKKHYIVRVYDQPAYEAPHHQSGFAEIVVSVIQLDRPEEGERFAAPEEHDRAIAEYEAYMSRTVSEKLQYHARLLEEDRKRSATLLDTMIRLKEHAIERIEAEKFDVDAEIIARTDVGTDEDRQHMEFLRMKSERLHFEKTTREAELEILRYKKWLRDRETAARLLDAGSVPAREITDPTLTEEERAAEAEAPTRREQ